MHLSVGPCCVDSVISVNAQIQAFAEDLSILFYSKRIYIFIFILWSFTSKYLLL